MNPSSSTIVYRFAVPAIGALKGHKASIGAVPSHHPFEAMCIPDPGYRVAGPTLEPVVTSELEDPE